MQPYSQETLGSFLVRWAWARGEQPAVLSHRLGLGYFVWTRDLDRSLSEEMLQAIAAASGCRLEQVRCMTYCSQLAAAAVPVHRSGFLPWLLPLGIYHRRRLRFGQLFCPACLREDMPRHLHMHWRLASSWICLRHGVSLMDACPHCGAPFAPYRNDSLVLGRCECCAFALYSAHPSTCSARQQAQQERVDALWRQAFLGQPLPLALAYRLITQRAKKAPDFSGAGEPWSYWRIFARSHLLENALARFDEDMECYTREVGVQECYVRALPQARTTPRSCWEVPRDPQLRARRILQIALRLSVRRSTASRVRARL